MIKRYFFGPKKRDNWDGRGAEFRSGLPNAVKNGSKSKNENPSSASRKNIRGLETLVTHSPSVQSFPFIPCLHGPNTKFRLQIYVPSEISDKKKAKFPHTFKMSTVSYFSPGSPPAVLTSVLLFHARSLVHLLRRGRKFFFCLGPLFNILTLSHTARKKAVKEPNIQSMTRLCENSCFSLTHSIAHPSSHPTFSLCKSQFCKGNHHPLCSFCLFFC